MTGFTERNSFRTTVNHVYKSFEGIDKLMYPSNKTTVLQLTVVSLEHKVMQ